jgi:SAM-dependent methyltransferase
MTISGIDALTSPTLKHLREHWWNDDFTGFLKETLRPRPGNRILDVGCGTGIGEISIGRLQLSQIRLYGVDLVVQHVITAAQATASHNLRARFAAADACHLPFASESFDSTYCVAVLQHIQDASTAVREFARVTRENGRILAVEPDNAARYWYSSSAAGMRAFAAATSFFTSLAAARDRAGDPSVGPRLPTLFVEHGIEPESVRLFPVSQATLGTAEPAVWEDRRTRIQRAIDNAPGSARDAGREYLESLAAYEAEAAQAGPGFVEIQTTMLFATVGQKGGR